MKFFYFRSPSRYATTLPVLLLAKILGKRPSVTVILVYVMHRHSHDRLFGEMPLLNAKTYEQG